MANPDEDLKYMVTEVRRYVQAVLNHLADSIPKVSEFSALPLDGMVALRCRRMSSPPRRQHPQGQCVPHVTGG